MSYAILPVTCFVERQQTHQLEGYTLTFTSQIKKDKMTINKLFDLLDDWRNLPAYQLERRADIFFAIHLEKIIEETLGTKIDFVIPEFPVRVGEISTAHPELNKSFKIDYMTYSISENKVYLIELKTDQRSRREKQDWYLDISEMLTPRFGHTDPSKVFIQRTD